MTGVDYFAWFVFIVIIVSVLFLFVVLAGLPGKIANARKHPQAEAINAAGWLGLLFSFGIIWVLALVWALAKPVGQLSGAGAAEPVGAPDEIEALTKRIAELETRLQNAGGTGQ